MAEKKEVIKYDLDDIAEFEAAFNKVFGKKSIRSGDEYDKNHKVQRFNSIGLDKASGIGGLPFGRIVEVYGWESGGKTTVCLEVIAQYMKDNPKNLVGFIDAEHALDKSYCEKLGVDIKRLKIAEPMNAEEGIDMAIKMITSTLFKVVVIDSVAALIPKDVIESDMTSQKMGLQARVIAKGIEKMTAIAEKNGVLLLIVNQLREKIGVMFGSPDVTKCGNAIKFYASMRLEVSRSTTKDNSTTGDDGQKLSNLTKVKFVKNKLAPPFTTAEFHIRYNVGIDRVKELFDVATDLDIIKKKVGIYYYKDEKIAKGNPELREVLTSNTELFDSIKSDILLSYESKLFEPIPEEIEENEEES